MEVTRGPFGVTTATAKGAMHSTSIEHSVWRDDDDDDINGGSIVHRALEGLPHLASRGFGIV